MADKEATVYIVDVGKSMSQKNHGRNETDHEYAMRYVWDRITTTIATGRKTLLASVIAVKSDRTNNELKNDGSYANIDVVHPLAQVQMKDLRHLQEVLKPSHTDIGDPISAITLAIFMIMKVCKELKYQRKIVVVTNGQGEMDMDNVDEIIKKINGIGIQVMVLGIDFDDEDFGYQEDGKLKLKAQNEEHLKGLVDACDGGVYGTLEAAVQELSTPRVKLPRPVPTFKGQLRLGNPEEYDSAMTIDVERYSRVMIARAPTASSFTLRSDFSQNTGSSTTVAGDGPTDNLAVVTNQYSYECNDPDSEFGKNSVSRDDLAKGYEYGRTVVHISESDQNITKLETEAALDLMGFVPQEKYERYMGIGQTYMIIAQKTNDKAILALSSFIHALAELETNAVARLVTKDGRDPMLVLLSPSIEADYECLIETQLPFAEDVRSYQFPPLDKVVTVSGKILTEHRNLPREKLLEAMSDYVDSMDLSRFGEDDEGNPIEYMKFEDTFSPLLHRIDQAVRLRAIDPKAPIQDPAPVLIKYANPPSQLIETSRPALDALVKAADVKKVPPKVKGRKRNRETDKPLSGLDIDDLFRKEKRTRISPDNAIPEFHQLLNLNFTSTLSDIETVKDLAKQMQSIIENHITNSFGNQNYDRVIEELGAMKKELLDYDEPGVWNEGLIELKKKLLAGELGGDRKEMWNMIRKNRVGLISGKQNQISELSEEDAKKLWSTS